MKIFPPISEMLWPPGYSARQLLWARRYPVFAIAVIGLAFSLPFSSIQTGNPEATGTASQTGIGNEQILVNGTNCRHLQPTRSSRPTSSGPCDEPMRLKAGQSLAASEPLPRGGLITTQGTLTAADRAIEPPKPLRTTIWNSQSEKAGDKPALAQTPRQ